MKNVELRSTKKPFEQVSPHYGRAKKLETRDIFNRLNIVRQKGGDKGAF